MSGAITIDFHNTLASSDAWFELEVRELPAAYLRWEAAGRGLECDADLEARARDTYRSLRREIATHGEELSAEACVEAVLRQLGLPVEVSTIHEGVENLMRQTFVEVNPLPGAVELVTELHAAGLPLAIVSNAVYHPFLEWSLEQFGLRDAFALVTTSASAGLYKSRTEIYQQTLERLGAVPGRSVHVGDSLRWDVATAKRAGMATVWLRHGDTSHDGHDPDLILASLIGSGQAILALQSRYASASTPSSDD